MDTKASRVLFSFPRMEMVRLTRMLVSAILMMGICLSAAVPVRPVFSASPKSSISNQIQAEVDVCLSPVISTNTTWATGNIYKADCIVTVNTGVTLTVQAGAVVQFGGSGRGLKVFGTLNVVGASGNPVAFTSLGDDPGKNWYGIVFYENSVGTFDYASIRYAGSGVCTGGYEDTTYNNCYNRAQVDVRKADLTINHSEIRNGSQDGIVLDTPGRTPSIQNTIISNNTNGNLSDDIGLAIYQSTINMQPSYANLIFSGNDRNQVVVFIPGPDYNLTQNVVLGGAPIGFTCIYTSCVMQIASGFSLAVEPGAILDMSTESTGFRVLAGGTLLIQGSESNPVNIIKGGIEVLYGGAATLDYCDISGGGGYGIGLTIRGDGVVVGNCAFHDFAQEGISAYADASRSLQISMTNVNVLNNTRNGIGIGMGAGGSVDLSLDGGSISDNLANGIQIGDGTTNLTLKNVTIDRNGNPNSIDWTGRNGILARSNNISLTLENVQFNNNVNESVYWNCNGSITAKNLSASSNARNALNLGGCTITTGRQWDLAEAGIPVIVTSPINIDSGGILSITPGTTLGFESGLKIKVNPNGALYALGTADKAIVFSRAYETLSGPTAWGGLENYKGTMILRHCEVAYSNYDSSYGGEGYGIILGGTYDVPTNTIIQNCRIHDNDIGISAEATVFANTSILYNEIYNNPTFGVKWGGDGPDAINAFYNYWGAAAGPYHATLNPTGTGNPVDSNINFKPFLTAPPADLTLAGDMWVSSGGPAWISPGEVNDYAIQYLNLMDHAVNGAVAVIQLPLASRYLSSTAGGTYWPARNQVFWVLGDIAPGAKGMLTARVRFDWGLAPSYMDGSFTMLSGTNYKPEQINLAEYIAFVTHPISDVLPKNQTAFNSWCASNAGLNALYTAAIAEGFEFREASETNFEGGRIVKTALMRTPDKKLARMLNLSGTEALAITTNGSTFFKIEGMGGGQLTNLLTLERSTWGSWASAGETSLIQANCNYARCMRNCSLKNISIDAMKGIAVEAGSWLLGLPVLGGTAVFVYEAVSKVADVYVCHEGCSLNPETGCCNPGQLLWSPSFIGGSSRCEKYECGYWNSFPAAPNTIEVCPTGSRCVAGNDGYGGCKPCTEDAGLNSLMLGPQVTNAETCADNTITSALPKCSDLRIRVAKDPNALYGPDGDVLQSDTMDYRITYENEGAGTAYGVYIINKLPEQLDETTLVINNGGVYTPAERQIIWYVGQLGPKGDPTSKGEVTYSAKLKPGLTNGTALVNQAIVYFPSVPEETPTNTYTNLVYSLVATPQVLTTNYMTAVPIILAGRPTGGLTFTIETSPMGGILTGTLPNLTYTPVENFTGVDFFTFTASVGGQTSQPAQVTINVSPTGDATSPTVKWVQPEKGQTGVAATGSAIYSVVEGGVHAPVIVAKFNEKLQEGSITSSSVSVADPGGVVVPSKASFDPSTNEVTIQLLSALKSQTLYTVALTTAIKDLAGNALAGNYSWQFTTGEVTNAGSQIFLPMINK